MKAWLFAVGVTAAAGTGGYFAFGHKQKLDAQITSLRAERGDVERKSAHAQQEAASQQNSATVLGQQLAALKPVADEAARKAAEKQELEKSNADLLAALRGQLEGMPVEASTGDGRVTLTFSDKTLFAAGQSEIGLDGYRVLFRVSKALTLKGISGRNAVVVVTTDARGATKRSPGAKPSGWDLSAARAVGVGRFLVDDVGLDSKRVSVVAPSPERPRKSGRNRGPLVEIRLEPVGSPTPTIKS